MAEQNIHINYSVADIERYLQGKMNAKEMHDMEKAALQDPFLSDAIEGYKSSPFATSYQHLNEITASLSAEKQPARVIAMPVKNRYTWKTAAVAAIFAGAGIMGWLLIESGQKQANGLAQLKIPVVSPQTEPEDSTKKDTTQPLVFADVEKRTKIAERTAKGAVKDKAGTTISQSNYAASTSIGPDKKEDTSLYLKREKDFALHLTQPAAGLQVNTLKPDSLQTGAEYYKNNNAYANNYVNINKPKGPSPVDNNAGYFNLQPAKQGIISTADSIKLINKNVETYTLNNNMTGRAAGKSRNAVPKDTTVNGNLIIVLTVNPNADTVPVTYLNNKNFSRKMITDSTLSPQGGWESFREYVYKRLHKEIDTTTDHIIEYGNVEVEFTVDKSGNAHNLKITKSLNEESDAKALDLVRKWPGWIADKKGKKGKVVIQF